MHFLKIVLICLFSFSVFSQEITAVKDKSFVMTLGSLKLQVDKTYSFLTSEDDLIKARVVKVKDGKAILKITDDSKVKKGLTLTLDNTKVAANVESANENEENNDVEENESTEPSVSTTYKTKNHQFGIALGFAKLPEINLKNASGTAILALDDVSLFGLTLSYQYYLMEFLSIGAAYKNYFGQRSVNNFTNATQDKFDSNFSMLDLFVAGHLRDFYLRLGFLPIYSFELEKDDETLELEGSGVEFALGYLHKFPNSSHCLNFELFGTSGDFDEATVKEGNTTVLSGKLIHKVEQKATGLNVGWAFQF